MEIHLEIFLIQAGIFLYCLFILKFFFFDPSLKRLKAREAATIGKTGAAEDFRKQIEQMEEKILGEVSSLKLRLDDNRRESLARARENADARMKEAKARMERQVSEKQTLLRGEAEKIRGKIPQLSESVSQEVVNAVMTAKVVNL